MCDYCVKHEMSPSELFQNKSNVCTSCGTKMGAAAGAEMGVAVAPTVSQAAQPPKVPAYKPDVDMWSSTEPPEEIREAWAAAAAASTADDALEKLSVAIKLGCKVFWRRFNITSITNRSIYNTTILMTVKCHLHSLSFLFILISLTHARYFFLSLFSSPRLLSYRFFGIGGRWSCA